MLPLMLFVKTYKNHSVIENSYLEQQRNVPDVVNIIKRQDVLNLKTTSVEANLPRFRVNKTTKGNYNGMHHTGRWQNRDSFAFTLSPRTYQQKKQSLYNRTRGDDTKMNK